MRLYALLALKRVWSLVEVRGEEGADGFRGLSTVIKACLNQAEAMQSTGWEQLQQLQKQKKEASYGMVVCLF